MSSNPPRTEKWIGMRLQLKLWGMTADGKPFSQAAYTRDVSRAAATLIGINCEIAEGEVVGVQYGDRKCRCQVVWKGESGTAEEGHLTIRCLEEAESPWAGCAAWDGSTAEEFHPSEDTPKWPQKERRRFPRLQCNGVIRMSNIRDRLPTAAKLTDISMSGCYAESMSPWPLGTELEMILIVDPYEIHAAGVIRTCHTIMGNGIEFTHIGDDSRRALEQLIAKLGTTPSLPAQPTYGREIGLEAKVEAILDILERKKVMSREELLQQLKQLRPPQPHQ